MVIDMILDYSTIPWYYIDIKMESAMPQKDFRGTIEERLLERVIITEDECWLFDGKLHSTGYGRIQFRGKPDYAHRISWIIHIGEIPEGLVVRHKCEHRNCFNPNHLRLGTQAENVQDRVEKYAALGIDWAEISKR